MIKYMWMTCLALSLAACSQAPMPASEEILAASIDDAFNPANAEMTMDAIPQSNARFMFVVTTNLPLPVDVMAGVTLVGQKPDDASIGHSERVTLTASPTAFVIETDNRDPLPSGEYDAKVSFHPDWGAQNANPAAKKAPELEATERITVGG